MSNQHQHPVIPPATRDYVAAKIEEALREMRAALAELRGMRPRG